MPKSTLSDDRGSDAGASPVAQGQAAVTASTPWKWSKNGDALITADGRFVIYPRAEGACGRGGDYYACNNYTARATLFVDPAQRALIAAAPDLLEALKEVRARITDSPMRDAVDAAIKRATEA